MSLKDKEKKATSEPAMEKERNSKTHIKNNRPVSCCIELLIAADKK
jgi:hypothetical protein